MPERTCVHRSGTCTISKLVKPSFTPSHAPCKPPPTRRRPPLWSAQGRMRSWRRSRCFRRGCCPWWSQTSQKESWSQKSQKLSLPGREAGPASCGRWTCRPAEGAVRGERGKRRFSEGSQGGPAGRQTCAAAKLPCRAPPSSRYPQPAHINARVAGQGRQAAALAWLILLQSWKGRRAQVRASAAVAGREGEQARRRRRSARQPNNQQLAHVEPACAQHAVGEQETGKGQRKGGLHGGETCGVRSGGGSEAAVPWEVGAWLLG